MKLSLAIATGRTVLTPYAGYFLARGQRGCALGMAGIADGLALVEEGPRVAIENYKAIETHWPWLKTEGPKCPVCGNSSNHFYTDLIAHIFDAHVAGIKSEWTLDQLIDWIRSVEPAEPATEEAQAEENFARMEEDFHDSRANTR